MPNIFISKDYIQVLQLSIANILSVLNHNLIQSGIKNLEMFKILKLKTKFLLEELLLNTEFPKVKTQK